MPYKQVTKETSHSRSKIIEASNGIIRKNDSMM